MSHETLDYQSPSTGRGHVRRGYPNPAAVNRAAWIAAAIVIVVNVGLVMAAADDGGFRALGIMTMIGPATNGLLFLVSVAFMPVVSRLASTAPVGAYVLTGTLLPILAVFVDGAWILSMDLHGC